MRHIYDTFYISLLDLIKATAISSHEHPTIPSTTYIKTDQEYFEVEDILDSHHIRNRLEYLIKWKVYPILTIAGNLFFTSRLIALSKNSIAKTLRNPTPHIAEFTMFPSFHPPTNLSGTSNFTSFKHSPFPFCILNFFLVSMSHACSVRHPENCYLLAIGGAIFRAILSFELFFCVLFVCYLYAICMLFACYQWVIPVLFTGYYKSVDSKKRARE